ncbi:MAG: cyclic nucleotide-binding domain-containing protein [Propylenella sp.]
MSVSLESDVDVLKRIPFFQGFSPEHLKLIAFSAESRSLPDKLLLYDEGQLLHSAYVVISGTLRGTRKAKEGERAASREIGAGAMLGDRALVLDLRADEAVRVESRARVFQIRKVMFRRLMQEYPEIAVILRSRLTRSVMQAAADFNAVKERLRAIEL